MPGLEGEDDELLSSLCPYCNTNPPIYTCPRCFVRTCSVRCCKKHKLYRQCNGVHDPTAFVKRSKLMTESGVNRDFNFLTSLDKQLSRATDRDGEKMEESSQSEAGKKIADMLMGRGTVVKWAPWRGFGRARENRSRIVQYAPPTRFVERACAVCLRLRVSGSRSHNHGKRRAHVQWTIEWILLYDDGRRVLDHFVSENQEVGYSFFNPTEGANEARKGNRMIKAETEFHFVLQAPGGKKRCVRIGAAEPWTEGLRERTVVEFPTVLVTKKGSRLVGWEVVEDERKIVEVKEGEISTKSWTPGGKEKKDMDGDGDEEKVEKGDVQPNTLLNLEEVRATTKRKLIEDDISKTLDSVKKARKTN
jgi:hypothetical protein